ncbi:hypothetical protein EBR66_05225 [bacterium]|nr:hypothetical protein [bacterium]
MSTFNDRQGVTRVAAPLPLHEQLRNAGIPIPNQEAVSWMMRVAQLGLHPRSYRHRVWARICEGVKRDQWRVFFWEKYLGPDPEQVPFDGHLVYYNWGGVIPGQVHSLVRQVRSVLPKAPLVVYALKEDPVLAVRYRGEEVKLCMWYRGRMIT